MGQVNKFKNFLLATDFYSGLKFVMLILILVLLVVLATFNSLSVSNLVMVALFIILSSLFLKWPNFGLYCMVFLTPFWGWQYVSDKINVPYVDLFALALFFALILRTVIAWLIKLEGEKVEHFVYLKKFFAWPYFALFFVASAFSLFNSPDILLSLKYLLRPLIFFYLMFVLLPINLILNKKIFKRVLATFLTSGIITAILGLLTVVLTQGGLFARRAQPFPVFGVNLLGGNWNALAETLVVAIPCAMIFYFAAKKVHNRGYFVLITMFLIAILLLTLSRSGWLVLFLQVLILLFGFMHKRMLNKRVVLLLILSLLIMSLVYVFFWGQISAVRGSDSSRWLMTSVAWYHFTNHPVIGNGLNTFNDLVGRTFVYAVEFGDPLDSHGFVQKLLAETGLMGLLTFVFLLGYLFKNLLKSYLDSAGQSKLMILLLIVMAVGVVFFQLFSTSYFLAKMWLPLGVCLAGVKLYKV